LNKFLNISILLAIIVASLIILSHLNIINDKLICDSEWYIDLATGNYHNVGKPFINRVVYPFIARIVVLSTGVDTKHAFLALNIVSLLILVVSLFVIIKPFISNKFLYVPIIFTPVLFDLYRNYCLPELFYAALLGIFFLLLRQGKLWISLAFLFLLFLTRENTIVLSLCIIIICFYKRQTKYAASVIVVSLAAIATISWISHYGQPNIHKLPEILYLALKIPINFISNFTGVIIWTNTLSLSEITARSWHNNPIFQVALPKWLCYGEVTNVGIYTFDIFRPLNTYLSLLINFGIGPVLLVSVLRRNYRCIINESPIWLLIAISYGFLSYLMGTSIGADVPRLVAYGWPAFWLATPILMLKYYSLNKLTIVSLLITNSLLCWFNTFLLCIYNQWYITTTITIFIAIIIYLAIIVYYDYLVQSYSKDETI
jgi:hypothetical protein